MLGMHYACFSKATWLIQMPTGKAQIRFMDQQQYLPAVMLEPTIIMTDGSSGMSIARADNIGTL
jgi:hypothetical protein